MKSLVTLVFGIATTLAAADLSGLVVAEHDGSPVVAAAISVRNGEKVIAELETDDTGIFRARGLAVAEYTIAATKASFTTAERRVALADAGLDILLQVTKLGVISGRVTDNQGNGIRNMVVTAIPVPADNGPLRVPTARPKGAATDATGRYRIFGLTAGDYVVAALAGNGRSVANVTNGVTADTSHGSSAELYPSSRSPRIFSIRGGEEHTNMNFTGYAGPLFTIKGTVSGPSPETAYRVSLVAEVAGIPLGTATAQPGKEFQFDRVAPGTYKIVAMRLPSNAQAIIDIINSGQIVITSANEAAIMRELEAARAEIANNPKAEPAFGETIVTVTQDLAGVTLSARPGVDAKLLYQPAPGCPASVQVTLNPIEYLVTGSTSKKLEAGKELSLTGMPSAAYSVSLDLPESSGCYAATSLVDFRQTSSGAAIPIVAAHMGSIQGKIDTTGHALAEFTVVVILPDGITKRTFSPERDSSFSIPNLIPGRYRVSVARRSAARVIAADQDVAVQSGATAQVEFPPLP